MVTTQRVKRATKKAAGKARKPTRQAKRSKQQARKAVTRQAKKTTRRAKKAVSPSARAARKTARKPARATRTTKKGTAPRKRATGSQAQDAIAVLKQDHREVEQLFKGFEKAGENAHRAKREHVDSMIEALSRHAAIEELVLYPSARREVRGADFGRAGSARGAPCGEDRAA